MVKLAVMTDHCIVECLRRFDHIIFWLKQRAGPLGREASIHNGALPQTDGISGLDYFKAQVQGLKGSVMFACLTTCYGQRDGSADWYTCCCPTILSSHHLFSISNPETQLLKSLIIVQINKTKALQFSCSFLNPGTSAAPPYLQRVPASP